MLTATSIIAYIVLLACSLFFLPEIINRNQHSTTQCFDSSLHAGKCAHCFVKPPDASQIIPITLEVASHGTLYSINSCQNYTCQQMLQLIDSTSSQLVLEDIEPIKSFLNVMRAQQSRVTQKSTKIPNSHSWVLLTETPERLFSRILYSDSKIDDTITVYEIIFLSTSLIIIIVARVISNSQPKEPILVPFILQILSFSYFLIKTKVVNLPNVTNELIVTLILSFIISLFEISKKSKIISFVALIMSDVLYGIGIIDIEKKSLLIFIIILITNIQTIKQILFSNGDGKTFMTLIVLFVFAIIYVIFSLLTTTSSFIAILWIMHISVPVLLLQKAQSNKSRHYSTQIQSIDQVEAEELQEDDN